MRIVILSEVRARRARTQSKDLLSVQHAPPPTDSRSLHSGGKGTASGRDDNPGWLALRCLTRVVRMVLMAGVMMVMVMMMAAGKGRHSQHDQGDEQQWQ